MTDKQVIEYIKSNQAFPKSFDDYFNYGVLIFPLAFIAMSIVLLYSAIRFGNTENIVFVIIFMVIGMPFLKLTWSRLRENLSFIKHKTDLNFSENLSKAYRILKDRLELKHLEQIEHLGLITGQTKISLFSWGETITVICSDNYVFINSKPKQPVTLWKDKANIKLIIQELESSN